MYYDGGHMGPGRWVFTAFVMFVLLGLLVAFVLWLVQDHRRRGYRDHYVSGGSASEILDRRLAAGEISVAEYERLKASLAGSTPPAEPPTAPKS